MPKGMPGNKSFYANPEEATALEKHCEEVKKQGNLRFEVSESSILKAALRKYLKLDK